MKKSQSNLRAQAALILHRVIKQHTSLEETFACYLSSDSSLVQELSYGVLRWYYRLDYLTQQLLKKSLKSRDLLTYLLLLIGLYQILFTRIPQHAAVFETVAAARALKRQRLAPLLNAILRRFLRERDKIIVTEKNLVAYYSHPQWLINFLKKAWPQFWQEILIANNQHAPLHLRVNLPKITRVAYLEQLKSKNLSALEHPLIATGVTVNPACATARLPGFADGVITVQDVAAQLAAPLLELAPGQRVLDACAAPGNKTAHLLEVEPRLQQVVAVELDASRSQYIKQHLMRLNLSAQVIQGDATQPQVWWDGKLFDRILLDAPCSASGVIRRHPEIKILRTSSDITRAVQLQRRLLQALWPLLKEQGILLYATCSIFPEENSENMRWFLAQQVDAREILISAAWGQAQIHGRQIFPGSNDMDGFYYVKIIKNGKIIPRRLPTSNS